MIEPKVSVVIPVFNRTQFLSFAISSALEQSYENIEVLVIDDGSGDKNEVNEQVKKFKDERILFFQKENGGTASALNYGINQMSGDYFAWLSDDDLFNPFHLEIAVKSLRSFQSPSIYFSNWEFVDSNNRSIQIDYADRQLSQLVTKLGPIERALVSLCSTVITKSTFDAVGLFNTNSKFVQDYEFIFRAAALGVPWEFSSYVGARIRWHSGQMTNLIDTNMEEVIFWKSVASCGAEQIQSSYNAKIAKEKLIFLRNFYQKTERFGAVEFLDNLLLKSYK